MPWHVELFRELEACFICNKKTYSQKNVFAFPIKSNGMYTQRNIEGILLDCIYHFPIHLERR